jgi:hypothetical protein
MNILKDLNFNTKYFTNYLVNKIDYSIFTQNLH